MPAAALATVPDGLAPQLESARDAMVERLLLKRLPKAAIVSIGHRSSLNIFHDRYFTLEPHKEGHYSLTETKRGRDRKAKDAADVSPA